VTAAVFLDRDGVINQGVMDEEVGAFESPYRADDVVLEDRAVEGLRVLEGLGVPLIVASNQPAAAKGRVSLAELWEVHERVIALLGEEGIALTDWRYCFHHPTGTVPQLSGPCPCRKPQAGLLRAAAERHGIDLERSWMIGDTDRDVGAGRAAGARTILLENPRSAHKRSGDAGEAFLARDLAAASAIVVAEAGKR
jgi:D-glycero-D-manno-heptose 1,7-bisphosphate phosphatase